MAMKFTIPGEPCGKGRPRVVRNNGVTRTYTPEKTANYENLVKLICSEQHGECIAEGPVAVTIDAYYGIPKSAGRRRREKMLNGEILPTKKPDADNVAKSICDSVNGIAYRDDVQVVNLIVNKYYSDTPRVEVEIRKMEE